MPSSMVASMIGPSSSIHTVKPSSPCTTFPPKPFWATSSADWAGRVHVCDDEQVGAGKPGDPGEAGWREVELRFGRVGQRTFPEDATPRQELADADGVRWPGVAHDAVRGLDTIRHRLVSMRRIVSADVKARLPLLEHGVGSELDDRDREAWVQDMVPERRAEPAQKAAEARWTDQGRLIFPGSRQTVLESKQNARKVPHVVVVIVPYGDVGQPRPVHSVAGQSVEGPRSTIEQDPKPVSLDQMCRGCS